MSIFPYAGSKKKIAPLITEIIKTEGYRGYAEPFLGSGAVFFKLLPRMAILNDIEWLNINLFLAIRDNPDKLMDEVEKIPPTREEFMSRMDLVQDMPELDAAATWYYLLWLCYNGTVFKKDGKPRLTFGDRYLTWEERLPGKRKAILAASKALQGAFLICGDYSACSQVDMTFFDPPWINSKEDYGVGFDHHKFAEYLRTHYGKWLLTINYCQETEEIYYPISKWVLDLSIHYSVAPVAHGRGLREERLLANFKPKFFGG